MADLSMCQDDKCPSRRECKRHAASGTRPNEYRQTYGGFQCPEGEQHCDYVLLPAKEQKHA